MKSQLMAGNGNSDTADGDLGNSKPFSRPSISNKEVGQSTVYNSINGEAEGSTIYTIISRHANVRSKFI